MVFMVSKCASGSAKLSALWYQKFADIRIPGQSFDTIISSALGGSVGDPGAEWYQRIILYLLYEYSTDNTYQENICSIIPGR